MVPDPRQLISGYCDEALSSDEEKQLVDWLNASQEHARQFAQALMLHDRLRSEVGAMAATSQVNVPVSLASAQLSRWSRPYAGLVSAAVAALIAFVVIWKGIGGTPASAAIGELNRIIAASAQSIDRTFRIEVEEENEMKPSGKRRPFQERGRPPKPTMKGAILHIRDGRQFVLIRIETDGRPFVTGSNGKTSWAVRPDGPVRSSTDLTRFSHDLPGHEHSIPLFNIQEGLEGLLEAYNVQLQALGNRQDTLSKDGNTQQMIIADRKSKSYRGPSQIEIKYATQSGHIQQMRFVDMPYDKQPRLTLTMILEEERNLGPDFFDHTAHHAPDRPVEIE